MSRVCQEESKNSFQEWEEGDLDGESESESSGRDH